MIKRRMLTAVFILAIIFSGCSSKPDTADQKNEESNAESASAQIPETIDELYLENMELALAIQKKYAESDLYDYGEPVNGISRDEMITINIGFDPLQKGMEIFSDIVALYQDADLTQKVLNVYEWNGETGEIQLKPPKNHLLNISREGLSKDEMGMEGRGSSLFEKDASQDWGNLGKMYMVRYVDLETGDLLEKPLISVVTVTGELETPEVKFVQTADGMAGFTWKSVKGAAKYFITEVTYSMEDGFSGNATVIGETDTTYWEPEAKGGDMIFNTRFRTFDVSEDDWQNPEESVQQYYREHYGEEVIGHGPVRKSDEYMTYYGVYAVSEEGTSMISNTYSEDALASLLVYSAAVYSGEERFANGVEGILNVPTHRWVVMCDGRLAQKLVNYDIDSAKEANGQDGELEISYTVEGTPLEGKMAVENDHPESVLKDLTALKKRQDGLRCKAGTIEAAPVGIGLSENREAVYKPLDTDIQVTANCALSEYLALNMLNSVESIDLTPFNESSDRDYLEDAFMEALYQNPLILAIEHASVSRDGRHLYLSYEDSPEERADKQQEIRDEVARVAGEIITDEMLPLEKEIAINRYLCDTAEYDGAALENAKMYDFMSVDEEFGDSFTPYGVLINKMGAGISYSGAFKLLADEAGLESIVVTGYMDGAKAHTWNRVNIDGEWQSVDVTNNDNAFLANAVFNLPDRASKKILVEDDRFVMDSCVNHYKADSDESEYYRFNGLYFDMDSIAEKLAEGLDENGTITLRTDYQLNDKLYDKIISATMGQAKRQPAESYYWLGVIYLSQ